MRFLNGDAYGGQIGELLSHNIYAYCNNNPVNLHDPSGYWAIPSYIKKAAVKYAINWWNKRNKDYYSYSTDCANFVSQCLHAGGIAMNSEWHSYRIETTSFSLKGLVSSKFRYDWDVSEAWRLVGPQYNYFKNSSYVSGELTVTSSNYMTKMDGVQIGDLLYFDYNGNGIPTHAAIITSISGGIRYAGHTTNRRYQPLDSFFEKNPNGKAYILLMK